MWGTLGKAILISEIKDQATKLRKKDANDTGNDDAGARALDALAAGVELIDLTGVTNPKSLKNIGMVLVAVGQKLIDESDRETDS